ncbi:MAG: hypothetical protein NC911_02585 [Candidatus Omnitrophica bacterium]|nr:hypothetical protein [Candidatus Omnitrophota bacterium]
MTMILLSWLFLLGISSSGFTLRFFSEDEPAEKLLHTLTIFYAQIVSVFTILGSFGLLKPEWLTVTFLFLAMVSLVSCRWKKVKISSAYLSLPSQLAIAFTLCVFLMVLDFQSMLPPLTTDGLLYHLPFAVHYVQTGRLSYPPLFFQDIAMTYYPHGGDLLYAFSLFSGNEHVVRFTQLPMVAVASLSLFQMMKRYGFSRENSVLGACLFSLVRPIAGQSFSCFVDLMMTAWFFTAGYYFSTGEKRKVFLGFLAAGLLIATKNFALIFFLLALPLLANNKTRLSFRTVLPGLIFFLLVGGFSYWRNLVLLGNPFFPATITLGNKLILPGFYLYERSCFFSSFSRLFRLFYKPTSLADPTPATSFLLFAGWLGGTLSGWRLFPSRRYLFLLPVLIPLFYLVAIPPAYHQIRHLLPIYGVLVFALIGLLERWNFARLLLVPVFLGFTRHTVPLGAWSKLAVFLLIASLPVIWPTKKLRVTSFIIAVVVVTLYFGYWRFPLMKAKYQQIRHFTWSSFYPDQAGLWSFVQENSGQGKTIAYVGQVFLYPLYGPKLANRVYYQSVNSIQPRLIHEYPGQRVLFPAQADQIKEIYRANPDIRIWMEGLIQHQTDWVLLRKEPAWIEYTWILENPECFNQIWEDRFYKVYQFTPSTLIHAVNPEKRMFDRLGLSFRLRNRAFLWKNTYQRPGFTLTYLKGQVEVIRASLTRIYPSFKELCFFITKTYKDIFSPEKFFRMAIKCWPNLAISDKQLSVHNLWITDVFLGETNAFSRRWKICDHS